EESLEAAKSLQDSFGVIHTVDADAHESRPHSVLGQQLCSLQIGQFGGSTAILFWFHRDADGEPANRREMPVTHDCVPVPLDSRFHHAIHGFEKVIAVCLYVKAHQVGS